MTEIHRLALNDGRSIPAPGFGLWQVPAPETARVVATALALGYRLSNFALTPEDHAAIATLEAGERVVPNLDHFM